MNCKRCLHPQWTHTQFDLSGPCEAVIHSDPRTIKDDETGITIEYDVIGHCICQAFISTRT